MNFGPLEIAIIAIVIFALFGYKKLPDATRAIGRSLRIFKGEMKGMRDDEVATKAEAQTVRAPLASGDQAPIAQPHVVPPASQPVEGSQPPTSGVNLPPSAPQNRP